MTDRMIADLNAALRGRGEPTKSGEPLDLPEAPAGTHLALRSGEWGTRPGILVDRYRDVRVERIYQARQATGYMVVGHELECRWPHVEEHPPCVEIYVTKHALAAAAERVPQTSTEAGDDA